MEAGFRIRVEILCENDPSVKIRKGLEGLKSIGFKVFCVWSFMYTWFYISLDLTMGTV